MIFEFQIFIYLFIDFNYFEFLVFSHKIFVQNWRKKKDKPEESTIISTRPSSASKPAEAVTEALSNMIDPKEMDLQTGGNFPGIFSYVTRIFPEFSIYLLRIFFEFS